MAEKKKFPWLIIAIIGLIIVLGLSGIAYFIFHIPIEAIIIGFLLVFIMAVVIFLILLFLNKREVPNLSKRNYEKTKEACLVSVPDYLLGKPLFLQSSAVLGTIEGFCQIVELDLDGNKTNNTKYVFLAQKGIGFISKLLPFLKKEMLIRIDPKLVWSLHTPDIILRCNTVKRLDNFFFTPVQTLEDENRELGTIDSEVFKEHSIWALEHLADVSEKSMKASSDYQRRKDVREGGLTQKISSNLNRDDEQ